MSAPADAPPASAKWSLLDLVREKEIIVCTGSGGVGKTTTAAVLALEGAKLGRKACVVTICLLYTSDAADE